MVKSMDASRKKSSGGGGGEVKFCNRCTCVPQPESLSLSLFFNVISNDETPFLKLIVKLKVRAKSMLFNGNLFQNFLKAEFLKTENINMK